MNNIFDLTGKTVLITGGSGLLGLKHAEAVSEWGAKAIILDIKKVTDKYDFYNIDITNHDEVIQVKNDIISKYGHIDVLINNAANNPKVEDQSANFGPLETFPLKIWQDDLNVGITGAFICTQVFGSEMAKQGSGSIINIGSIYGSHISPHQELYKSPKPVSYNVVKAALVGLTKYTAIYWAPNKVRCNIVTFGGVSNNQPSIFVDSLSKLIPMGRMAFADDYKGIIVYLASDASSYMTGSDIVIDGGMISW